MANTKISALPAGSPLQTTDQLPVARAGANAAITGDGVTTLVVGNTHTKFSGPATTDKTFALPDANATILTNNAAVTVPQGGTGVATLTAHGVVIGNGAGVVAVTAAGTAGQPLVSGGAGSDPSFTAILAAANGGAAQSPTSGEGGTFVPFGQISIVSTGTTGTLGVNATRAMQFVLPNAVTFTQVTVNIVATLNGNNFFVGIYSASGTTLLRQVTVPLTAATGIYTITVASTTLPPGIYWLMFGADNATVTASGQTNQASPLAIFNATRVRAGNSNAVVSGGVLPSTIGTLSAANVTMPLVFLS